MITFDLYSWFLRSGIDAGLLTLWCGGKHTSASLAAQENVDPAV